MPNEIYNKELLEFGQIYFEENGHLYKKTLSKFNPGQFYFSIYADTLAPYATVFQFMKSNVKTLKKNENPFTTGAIDLIYVGGYEMDFAFLYTDIVKNALIKLRNGEKIKKNTA